MVRFGHLVDPADAWDKAEAAADYARGRPGYPAAAIDYLSGALGVSGDSQIVDVGAGTGKFTHTLLAPNSRRWPSCCWTS